MNKRCCINRGALRPISLPVSFLGGLITNPMLRQSLLVAAVGLVAEGAGTNARADLIIGGGFEPPNPTTIQNQLDGGYFSYFVGNSFGGPNNDAWTVVRKGSGFSDVAVTPTTEYRNSPYPKTYYNGHSGLQWMDLTGDYDNGVVLGIQQVVTTTPGTQYNLSFFVGSFNSTPAPVELEVNGISIGTFVNSMPATFASYNGDGYAGSVWEQFTCGFTAANTSTTIAFFNRAVPGVLVNGLDDVVLQVVPEPSCLTLAVFGALGFLGRHRRRVSIEQPSASLSSLM